MTLKNINKAPFPWFGGKSKAASLVWSLLGDVDHYVEPFFGSGAVLLNRPHPCNRAYYSETVNDLDGFVVNAWRAIQWHPEETAAAASWPVTEADKTARQAYLLRWRDEKVLDLLAGSPEWCDPTMAGWWLWSVCCQIGAFSGDGAWIADPVSGRLIKQPRAPREPGVVRNIPHLGNNGQGVNHAGTREPGVVRDLPHLGDNGRGVNRPQMRQPGVVRNRPDLGDNGKGVNRPQMREPGVVRDRPHLTGNGQGMNHAGTREPGILSDDPANEFHQMTMPELIRWFQWLSARLRHVRILNGDWTRAVTRGASWTLPVRQGGVAGIFLDPPYDNDVRSGGLYQNDDGSVANACRAWCIENGNDEHNRIVLAGYDTEHQELEQHGWTVHEWFSSGFLTGGMGNIGKNGKTHQQHRERLWASPHCLRTDAQPVATLNVPMWKPETMAQMMFAYDEEES